ncbi:hypothetical protein [Methanolobus sp. ZRKC5]|uniref:hypothetical protein n=1 Tax=unclassified Methanolobus TaxID=2629569 RepID=UPI00313D0D64
MVGVKITTFFRDTRGVDTIPLKMVFYLAVTCAVIFLVAFSWNSLSPIYSGAKDSKQINDAALLSSCLYKTDMQGPFRNIIAHRDPRALSNCQCLM